MRRVSNKKRKQKAIHQAAKREWFQSLPKSSQRCWLCGGKADDVHHILRRSNTSAERYERPENWVVACRRPYREVVCHDTFDVMPKPDQLAYKKRFDSKHYDLKAWLAIRDEGHRKSSYVTEEEVDAAALELFGT